MEPCADLSIQQADGRTLYVYRRDDGGARRPTAPSAPLAAEPDIIPIPSEDDAMIVDEAAEAREANNRMREERRRESERGGRDGGRDAFPAGPRGYRDDYYDLGGPRRDGYGGEGRYGGYGGGGYRGPGGGRYDGPRERGYGGGGGRGWR